MSRGLANRILILAVPLAALLAWPATSAAQPLCAKKFTVLRKGPGTKHPISWKVSAHMPFLRLESQGSWVKVQDLDGEVHWARRSDLTNAYRCVVVKSTVASLRREPSAAAANAEMKTLDRFTPLKRLESRDEWIQVQDEDGRKAWIHETNVWKPVVINSFSF